MRRNLELATSGEENQLQVANIRMDVAQHKVWLDGVLLQLPLKEFELLCELMRSAGNVLSRTELIERIWGSNYVGDTKTLDVHIKRLRSKFEKDPSDPKLIQTIRGLGYKIESI